MTDKDSSKRVEVIFQRTGGVENGLPSNVLIDPAGNRVINYASVEKNGSKICDLDPKIAKTLIDNAFKIDGGFTFLGLWGAGDLTGQSSFKVPENFIPNLCSLAKPSERETSPRR